MKTWDELAGARNADIVKWAGEQPWAHAMASCMQDAGWHAEGDVWTHTKMVCAELERLDDWHLLDRRRQLLLLFTALFHDAGKPEKTVICPDTGRTRSPHHAAAGAVIARRVLRELGCDLETREHISGLVLYHGRPPYLLEKKSPEAEVIKLSWLTDNRLLYLFAVADTRGRDGGETARPEETLHMWKLAAEEQNCFEQPYPFANDHARFLFYRGELSHPGYAPYEQFDGTMTLLSGLPGAGKDTWLKKNRPGLPVVSLDEIRKELGVDPGESQGAVIDAGREQCREFLRADKDFALNATNISAQIRKRWIDLGADYNARVEIVYIEPSVQTILAQNKRRPKPVPESVILSLLEKLEPPTWAEAHRLLFV